LLTVTLNPAATSALQTAIRMKPRMRWVAWCEDLSAGSHHVSNAGLMLAESWNAPLTHVMYVTISEARRHELASHLSISPDGIRVIRPPVWAAKWLGLEEEATRLFELLRLGAAIPLVLVPSKLLPHKNLTTVMRVARALQQRGAAARVLVTAAASPHEPNASATVRADLKSQLALHGLQDCVTLADEVLGATLSHRTVRDLMLLADIVFIPSTEEGYGMAVREAGALRVPTLCADIPALRESGGDATSYFPLIEEPEITANRIMALTTTPANRLRRDVLRSWDRFQQDTARLVEDVSLPPRTRIACRCSPQVE
jgi:glycosyltransferase involved in cell wall biosynthesis